MTGLLQERPAAVNPLLCDGKEVVSGIHVLVDEMHAALLVRGTLPLTSFHETRILSGAIISIFFFFI